MAKKISKKHREALEYIIHEYGGKKIELDYETPFQLLVAVMLSAQTTDKQVNKVTPSFFKKVRAAEDAAKMEIEEIEEYLKYINYFRNKSRFVKQAGSMLANSYNGEVLNSLQILTTLP